MTIPTTTYRLQLREGVGFGEAEARLPHLAALGVSHVYLSPVFTAASGSSHGYDVADPNEIDPTLGGRSGYERFARAAVAAGLGVILDIVPNHTAFHVDNPWLRDVLRHGRDSRWASFFDIDWDRGRLILPWLSQPFESALEAGSVRVVDGEQGPVMTDGGVEVPLAPNTAPPEALRADPDALRAAHERQVWRLAHWEIERDGVTHRRFFNVTGLIGMRVEAPHVFDAMHALPLALLRNGLAHGLRVDHVDGLADPGGYLRRLRAAAGDAPIWVEKILTGDEAMPDWPIEGSTGYEAGRAIARVLTDADGIARLDRDWRAATGREGTFGDVLRRSKREVLRHDLAAELHALIALGRHAAEAARDVEVGDEALREAVIALLAAFPRYRTYFTDEEARDEDRAVMARVVEEAAEDLRSDRVVRFLAALVTDAETPEAVAFRTRFQQVTGALLAKSHEDTAAFRWTRFLAASEVGAEPDEATLDAAGFERWLSGRKRSALTLTSSHDSKRSEDARARLIALSHEPDAFAALWATTPQDDGVPPDLRWYIAQSLLAVWEEGRDDLADRLAAHVEKAMREAKESTSWTHPQAEPEARALAYARALVARWGDAPPEPALRLIARGEALALCQTALKLLIPGVPDIYQGSEGRFLALTDPDNRRAVDWDAIAALADARGFSGSKARLVRTLTRFRRDEADFFVRSSVGFSAADGGFTLRRSMDRMTLTVRLRTDGQDAGDGGLWPTDARDRGACVAVTIARAG